MENPGSHKVCELCGLCPHGTCLAGIVGLPCTVDLMKASVKGLHVVQENRSGVTVKQSEIAA